MQDKQIRNKTCAVIGYGRFGQLWAGILARYSQVRIYESNPLIIRRSPENIDFVNLKTALSSDIIFLCIPISSIRNFLKENKNLISQQSLVIDTASVKKMPVDWMDEFLPDIPHLGIHPLFGPDSYYSNRINLIILTPSRQYPDLASSWSSLFESWSFFTKIIPPEKHDENIACSQGLTHFIGNILNQMDLPDTHTPTLGYNMLRDVERFCRNDTSRLFHDMLHYNFHTADMFRQFIRATHDISASIRHENIISEELISLGVMGDKGSFSHEAGEQWLIEKGIKNGHIEFLTTAEQVYHSLEFGRIQVGLLPIQNAAGGVVLETVKGLADHQCRISGFFPFLVEQCLLGRNDIKVREPVSIHSHPQALRQCRKYLKNYYPRADLVEENDTAVAANKLFCGKIPKDSYIIAPKKCSNIYNLKLIEAGIQDLEYNITDFITVTGN